MIAEPGWHPTPQRIAAAAVTRLAARCGVEGFDGLRQFALADHDAYWRAVIADLGLTFRRPFDAVLDDRAAPAWPRWFPGGRLNFTDIALAGPDDAPALICLAEDGSGRDLDRAALRKAVETAMARLVALGIGRGDRVGLLLPNIAEAAIVMLAVARAGAIVVPLYSGFGPEAIATRLNAAGARLLVTCDGFRRQGRDIAVKQAVDAALARAPTVERVALVRRLDGAELAPGRDVWWDQVPADAQVASPDMDPDDPWMIIYTSGTTGRPKGTVHTHAGFPFRVAHDTAYQFDFHAGDRFFWYSDMGWMIGPLGVCAPLMLGGTLVLYDGGPAVPDAAGPLRVAIAAGVTHFGSAPTLIRAMAAAFPVLPADCRPACRTLMTAGEAIDPETFAWYQREVGGETTPVINYTGGTEVSGGILSNVVVRPIVPGGFNAAVTDVDADVVGDDGRPLVGTVGELVIRRPMIGMTRGFWDEPMRYLDSYWQRHPGLWAHGDLAVRHGDGTWELRGRADDVLKVSGRRVGPSEIEEAAMALGTITAAAAIGMADARAGQAVWLFVVPRPAFDADALRGHLGAALGPGLRPARVIAVADLPRTRNGKILRRVVRNIAAGEAPGDLSSLDNPAALDLIATAI